MILSLIILTIIIVYTSINIYNGLCIHRYQHILHYRGLRCSASNIQPFQEYGPNNFGDIMGALETYTKFTGTQFSPLERIIITANGNLQRILSAYYGLPITISIKKCDLVEGSKIEFDREVDLICDGKIICTATGRITIYSERCMHAITEKKVGVGQLFRYFQVLPTFTLLRAGYLTNNHIETENTNYQENEYNLWREYELSCSDVKCVFIEKFKTGFLSVSTIKSSLSSSIKITPSSLSASSEIENISQASKKELKILPNDPITNISSASDCTELP